MKSIARKPTARVSITKASTARWTMLGCVLLSACGTSDPIFCTEEARAGVVVEVFEAVTGAPILRDATLTLKDGEYVESNSDVFSGRFLAGAWERAGTYEVTVEKSGFVAWRRTGVEVTADECHVITVNLKAELLPDTLVPPDTLPLPDTLPGN